MARGKRKRATAAQFERAHFGFDASDLQTVIVQLHRAYGDVDALEERAVWLVRSKGGSWADVGQVFGMSAQGAHQRFGGPSLSVYVDAPIG